MKRKNKNRKQTLGGKKAVDETMKNAEEKAEEKAPAEADGAVDPQTEAQTQEVPAPEEAKDDGRLEAAQKKADEYLEMAQRVQADFDNFRRRNQQVRAEAYEDGAREAVKLFLPVLDNLERALQAESADEKLKAGVEMIYKQFCGVLEKRGVTAIDRKGEKFDPRLENAVMQADKSMGEPGTVCQVLQKGYAMGDVVLRHAMVQVVEE